ILHKPHAPAWIFEGDIQACFDRISHDWLLTHVPMDKVILRKWLKAGYLERYTLHPTDRGTPQGGIISPPTKLQTFCFGVRIARIWIDAKDDIDVISSHLHAFDQRPDEVALARPVGRLQAVMEFGCKIFETSDNELQFSLHGGLICQGL